MFDMIKSSPILWLIIFLAVVAPSFLVGAVKVIFYIILGLILLSILLSAFFSFKIRSFRSRMEEQMRGGQQQQQPPHSSQRRGATEEEGDVRIYTTPEVHEKRVRKDVGDYVDFEEIKNKN